MIEAWLDRGGLSDEAALLATWAEPKTAIDHASAAGDRRFWSPTDPRNLIRLREQLRDRWLIVTLFPGPLTHFASVRRPVPVSRHGRLLPFEDTRDAPGLPHAVVLVETVDPGGVRYLDPYYPPIGQPWMLTDEQLVECWTGHVVIPRLAEEVAADVMDS